jgi:hypothetical protein
MRKLLLGITFSTAAYCYGKPTILIDSPKAKCIAVEAAQDTILRVEYDAPDTVVDKMSPEYGPTYLTINVQPKNRVMDSKLHSAPIKSRLKTTSQVLESKQGSVTHKFEVDGEANVCIRSSSANPKFPQLFGLRVETNVHDLASKKASHSGDEASADVHLSQMELEMQRIQNGMRTILNQADFAKTRDAEFHIQTKHMHEASMWWPVVQVCILIITGFTQASHITRFFQSRRII